LSFGILEKEPVIIPVDSFSLCFFMFKSTS